MSDRFILNEAGEPIPCENLHEWGRWFETENRIVARDVFLDCRVSTVFLGLDHSFGKGPPILWETMVFGGEMNQEQDRCSGSREQAEAMHKRMVEKVRSHVSK